VRRRGDAIAIGAATDPYQPGEGDYKVTRRFLELVAQQRGLRLSITTKGALILRDVELLQRIQGRSSLKLNVSLISPHAELLRRIEPLAPPPEVRLHVMRRLVDAGLDVSLIVAPVLPALTDGESDLGLLFELAKQVGVQSASHALLFLRSPTREKYFRWLAAEFPRYLEAYQRAYSSRVYLGGGYRRRIDALILRLRERHGLRKAWTDEAPPQRPRPPAQLPLWG
jgi:DNA repair photolyase